MLTQPSQPKRNLLSLIPSGVSIALRSVIILVGIAIVVIPWLPRDPFTATDPVSHQPFVFLRSHVTHTKLCLLWAFRGWATVPFPVRFAIASAVIILTVIPFQKKPSPRSEKEFFSSERRAFIVISLAAIAAIFLFYFARTSYESNKTFADGSTLPGEVEQGLIFPAEVLTCHVFIIVRNLLGLVTAHATGLSAIILTSCIAGGLFVAALLLLALRWGKSRSGQAILFFGTAAAGYTSMFFGYVETTQLELTSMALLFVSSALALGGDSRATRNRWKIAALVATSLALLSHAAGILLLPACGILLVENLDGPLRSLPGALLKSLTPRRMLLVIAVIVVPYYLLIIQPFFLQGRFGNITGGGDKIMFVPLTIDYAHRVSPYILYSMFSAWHFMDILSAIVVACPLSIALIVSSMYIQRRYSMQFTESEKQLLLVIGSAAAFCALVPLIWNHDYGMWGDWSIAAAYLFPLNVFGWILFATVHKRMITTPRSTYGLVLPLVLIQICTALGMLLQLY